MTTATPTQRPGPSATGPRSLARLIAPTDADLRRGRRRLSGKAAAIGALAGSSYTVLVFAPVALPVRVLAALVLVFAVVAIGTGVMHDANHGALGRSRRINHLVGYSSDLLGASSWIWRYKHNRLHHANTNVTGKDSDIDQAPFARLAPDQPWHPWHRYQHIYLWALYGLLTAKWFAVSDFVALARGGFGENRFPVPPGRSDVALVMLGKVLHLTWAIAIPLVFFPWWGVLAFYLACHWLTGFILAVTFQLAHCTDRAEFFGSDVRRRGHDFELQQLSSTADIRCRGSFAAGPTRWLMGGLDHQVVHHLSPRVPHNLYPQMASELDALCAERDLDYRVHPSLTAALTAHARWLKAMGQRPVIA